VLNTKIIPEQAYAIKNVEQVKKRGKSGEKIEILKSITSKIILLFYWLIGWRVQHCRQQNKAHNHSF